MFREILKLIRPIDADKEIVITTKPSKLGGDFEAYTDDKKIFINVSNEPKLQKSFENVILPIYKPSAAKLYDVKSVSSDLELLTNLVFDSFLFIDFHEELHPWVCPNSKYDERTINKNLFDGISKAEKTLSKAQAMYKVNNCKNLIWDFVINTDFVSKVAGYNNDDLEKKINYVFVRDGRKIEYQPVTHYPSGILPVLYLTSAKNHTTDIPISLMGAMYTTMSYNDSGIRQRVMDIFHDDLKSKKLSESESTKLIEELYRGLVSEIDSTTLKKKGIDKLDYLNRIKDVMDLTNPNYEANQRELVSMITTIFDSSSMRYDAIRGLIQPLAPYVSMSKKQGSIDPNTSSSGDSEDKDQNELDGDSLSQTLDDLMDTLDKKDADELLSDVANDTSGGGSGAPGPGVRKRISTEAADAYYKKNAVPIEIRNPSEKNVSIDLGNTKKWKLASSNTLTATEAVRLNHTQIANFEKRTGLPILMDIGSGYFKLNRYKMVEVPLKSYSVQKSGIEIPNNFIIWQDSSSSMTGSTAYVGSKNRFDILNHVKYGVINPLYRICKELKIDLGFGIIDFSDHTVYRGIDSLIKIYEAKTHPIKEISLIPQCGGTYCNGQVFDRVEKDLWPGKTIQVLITDGGLSGGADTLYNKIEKFVSKPGNAFGMMEVDSSSTLGDQIRALSKTNPAIMHYAVKDVMSIKNKLGSILVKYT